MLTRSPRGALVYTKEKKNGGSLWGVAIIALFMAMLFIGAWIDERPIMAPGENTRASYAQKYIITSPLNDDDMNIKEGATE